MTSSIVQQFAKLIFLKQIPHTLRLLISHIHKGAFTFNSEYSLGEIISLMPSMYSIGHIIAVPPAITSRLGFAVSNSFSTLRSA